MSDKRDTMLQLLLSYMGLLAERHAYAPGDGFEYVLWDHLLGHYDHPTLVSPDERDELVYLAEATDSWVTYDFETRMLQTIDLDAWRALLEKRGH